MTTQKRIESIKKDLGQVSRPTGVAPSWIPPVFKRFYDFAKKMAKEFSKHLLEDREEELIKKASEPFRYM